MLFFFIISAGILSISFGSILVKLCAAPALVIASYRLALASLVLLALLAVRRINPLSQFRRADLWLALLSGSFLCLHFATWITSLKYISVANAVVLVATTPVFVGLGSALLLQERPTKMLMAGGLLTLAGTLVIGMQEFGQAEMSLPGNLLALCGAVSYAGYFIAGRRLRTRIAVLPYTGVVYTIAAALLLAMALTAGHSLFGYQPATYGLLFLIAFVPQAIGHTSFNWALQHVSATLVSILALSEPVIAPVLAVFILGESLTPMQILGGIVILAGVVLALGAKPVSETEAAPGAPS